MKYGTYKDEYVLLAEVAFICDKSNNLPNLNNVKIVYEDVGTASEEIY